VIHAGGGGGSSYYASSVVAPSAPGASIGTNPVYTDGDWNGTAGVSGVAVAGNNGLVVVWAHGPAD
jgi:hypothetical protein